MKASALIIWFIASVLLICIVRMENVMTDHGHAVEAAKSEMLAVAADVAVLAEVHSQEPLSSTLKVEDSAIRVKEDVLPPGGGGCSRLGVFPRQDWAERVGVILAAAQLHESVDALDEAKLLKQDETQPWTVQKTGKDRYYLRFEAWDIDELALRMTRQRAHLKRLVSANAIPETC